jgi:D-alanyl-D-alanine dipeptidase
MIRLLAVALLACAAVAAHAQLRTVPPDAKRGVMRHLQDMVVQIDQAKARLAPGAQIRDIHNRLVLPTAMAQPTVVKYQMDALGHVSRVWVLTPEEAAASAPPPAPKPAPKPVPAKPAAGTAK